MPNLVKKHSISLELAQKMVDAACPFGKLASSSSIRQGGRSVGASFRVRGLRKPNIHLSK